MHKAAVAKREKEEAIGMTAEMSAARLHKRRFPASQVAVSLLRVRLLLARQQDL